MNPLLPANLPFSRCLSSHWTEGIVVTLRALTMQVFGEPTHRNKWNRKRRNRTKYRKRNRNNRTMLLRVSVSSIYEICTWLQQEAGTWKDRFLVSFIYKHISSSLFRKCLLCCCIQFSIFLFTLVYFCCYLAHTGILSVSIRWLYVYPSSINP